MVILSQVGLWDVDGIGSPNRVLVAVSIMEGQGPNKMKNETIHEAYFDVKSSYLGILIEYAKTRV